MLQAFFGGIIARGASYEWPSLANINYVKCIGHSGWLYNDFKGLSQAGLKQLLLAKYMDPLFLDTVLAKGTQSPANLLTVVVTAKNALSGIVVPGATTPDGTIVPSTYSYPGSNALPESWIPTIAEVLVEVCQYCETQAPGQRFLFSITSTFFNQDADGSATTTEYDGKTCNTLSSIAILASSGDVAITNKWDSDLAVELDDYIFKSNYERLTGAIKNTMDAKIQALNTESSGILSIETLTCRAANQLTDVNQPDMVLLSVDPRISLESTSAMATLAEYGPYGLFVAKTLNTDIDDTGSYEAVPNAEQWRVLNENVELGKSQELPSYCRQLWQVLTGLTKPLDLSSPYMVNLDTPVRGNTQPSSSPLENIPPMISMTISDSAKLADSAENNVIITDPIAVTPVPPEENPDGSIRNPYIWKSRINMPATGGISDTPKPNTETRKDRAGLPGTSELASDKEKAESDQNTKVPETGPGEGGQTGAEGV